MKGSDTNRSQAGTARTAWPTAKRPVRRLGDLLLKWLQRTRERRQLDALAEHMLKDIGLSRADVEREVSKPFWRG